MHARDIAPLEATRSCLSAIRAILSVQLCHRQKQEGIKAGAAVATVRRESTCLAAQPSGASSMVYLLLNCL